MSMTPFYLTVSCFVTAEVSAYLGTSILQYHLPTQEYSPLFHYSDLVFSPSIKFYISLPSRHVPPWLNEYFVYPYSQL